MFIVSGLPQLAFVTMLPVQRVWWILPGTSSFLNCSGRSVARWGMCRSPMHSTSTMSQVLAGCCSGPPEYVMGALCRFQNRSIATPLRDPVPLI